MDILLMEAQRIATEFGFLVYSGRCDCGWPLMETKIQRLPFCYFCWNDRRCVEDARALLLKIKMNLQGYHIGNEYFVRDPGTFDPPYIPDAKIQPSPEPAPQKGSVDWDGFLARPRMI